MEPREGYKVGEMDPLILRNVNAVCERKNVLFKWNSKLSSIFCGKLGMVEGVIIPTTLNIFGVILFLRLSLVVGQCGIWGAIMEMIVAYLVTGLTSISIGALCTNGNIKGGGAYFMLSRSMGKEIGGAVGIVFYLGAVAGCCTSVMGFSESMIHAFSDLPMISFTFPDSHWWRLLYAVIVLTCVFVIVFVGSQIFAFSSFLIFIVLIFVLYFSMISFVLQKKDHFDGYTSWSFRTFLDNFKPTFMNDPEGEVLNPQKIFGIMFPACTDIMAGINLSGDLKNPSRDIPKGTMIAVGYTFLTYISFMILFAFTTTKQALVYNYKLTQQVTSFPLIVSFGIFAAALSSCLSNFIGAGKVLQAVSKDKLLPFTCLFAKGFGKNNEPRIGVFFTYVVIIVILVFSAIFKKDLNFTAPYSTQFHIIAYGFTNFACLVLSIASAPNFRPTFKLYHWTTALAGTVCCIITMILCDYIAAVVSVVVLITIMIIIHFYAEKKTWGNVIQALIYHQVRKYLLMLDERKDSTQFWRFQPLLLLNSDGNPQKNLPLILFMNNLKKGGTFILGTVKRGDFLHRLKEIQEEHEDWLDFITQSKIKAFAEIAVGRNIREGAQNLMMIGGIGAMKPNAIVISFLSQKEKIEPKEGYDSLLSFEKKKIETTSINYLDDENEFIIEQPQQIGMSHRIVEQEEEEEEILLERFGILSGGMNENNENEDGIEEKEYIDIINDAIEFDKSVLLAINFHLLQRDFLKPSNLVKKIIQTKERFIDLWIPFFFNQHKNDYDDHDVVLTLQLGWLINQVSLWRKYHQLRLFSIVGSKNDLSKEREIMKEKLEEYRIPKAKICVIPLEKSEIFSEKQEKMTPEREIMILNELMRKYSSPHQTSFIFSTLPTPPPPPSSSSSFTSSEKEEKKKNRYERYERYLNNLRVLSRHLPPILLVHGSEHVISIDL